jgi:SAM-dependent MidA family methyltransferase
MNSLSDKLAKQIARQGVISFANYMEQALYCPNLGYYERRAASIGRAGDYFTAVATGPMFGRLLAWRFAAWLRELPGEQQLVEAGAHDGRLAHDILDALRRQHPAEFERVRLCLVEPSASRRAWQAETLREFSSRVCWWSSWDEAHAAGGVTGIIYANELLDAFPVRRFGWDAPRQRWFEWGVSHATGTFVWVRMELADPGSVEQLLAEHGLGVPPELAAVLPDGFTVECAPEAIRWWGQAARALRRGRLLTLDYGREATGFLQPHCRQGTLRAFRQHRPADDPLAMPGEQDLTADVNFTAVRSAGEAAGLITECFQSQEQFFSELLRSMTAGPGEYTNWTPSQVRQVQTLLHPEHLGRAFHVLVQRR